VLFQYLEENLGALKVKLSADEVNQVRKLAEDADNVEGPRYPSGGDELLYVDTPERK
jgi:hypothetical protein